MGQLVQSALDAAKRGDKDKAIELLKQSLSSHPNDAEAWLVLAAVVDDPERKRHCLNRVLTLDPTNQMAREELLEMDRAYMGATDAQPLRSQEPAPAVSTSSPGSSARPISATPAKKTADRPQDKTLVFQYPLIWRILVFVLPAISGCFSLAAASEKLIYGLIGLAFTLLFVFISLAALPRVEITETGIHAGTMLSKSAARWDQLTGMKSSTMKRRLELTKTNGEVVHVSTQVSGYPTIVEMIRQKRPDLFGITSQSSRSQVFAGTSTSTSGSSYSAPAFTGIKTFKRSSLALFGSMLFLVFLLLFGGWMIFSSDGPFVGIAVSLIALFFIVSALFNTQQIKVEPNKLTTDSFFAQNEYAANQIREITMKTIRNQRGTATNYVHVQLNEGKALSFSGFPEGNEVLYATLISWWETYRNR